MFTLMMLAISGMVVDVVFAQYHKIVVILLNGILIHVLASVLGGLVGFVQRINILIQEHANAFAKKHVRIVHHPKFGIIQLAHVDVHSKRNAQRINTGPIGIAIVFASKSLDTAAKLKFGIEELVIVFANILCSAFVATNGILINVLVLKNIHGGVEIKQKSYHHLTTCAPFHIQLTIFIEVVDAS